MKRLCILFALVSIGIYGCKKPDTSDFEVIKPGIRPVVNGEYFTVADSLINAGQKSIRLVMFEISYYADKKNSRTNRLIQDLISARKRGVNVKVLMEGGEQFLGERFKRESHEVFDILKKGHINVRADCPDITTHAKMLIVDDNVLLGSTNWTYFALNRNNEINVLITGKTDSFKIIFDNLFKKGKRHLNSKFVSGTNIKISGVVSGLKKRISRKGHAYMTFYIRANGKKYRVYRKGHAKLNNGDRVLVRGKFFKEKRIGKRHFFNEIEAYYIRHI